MNRENKRRKYEKGYYKTHPCTDSFTCKVCGRLVVSAGAGRKTDCKGGLEMTEKERMLAGKLYCPFKVGDNTWEKSREVLEKFNSMPWHQEKERMQLLREIFGHLEEDAVIVPPFYCDKGTQIYIGKHFYANTGLLILDEADVRIGGNTVINPGVTIGNNVVIGSGSVVTRDIPDQVIAAGCPCRVIRKITEEDREYWTQQAEEYFADEDIRGE